VLFYPLDPGDFFRIRDEIFLTFSWTQAWKKVPVVFTCSSLFLCRIRDEKCSDADPGSGMENC
jgi:hypothetical protein